MVKLRLQRHGSKKRPFYRVVAADSRCMRDGRFLEVVGTYNPIKDPAQVNLKLDRIDYWIEQGAQTTDTVASLIRQVRREAPAAAPAAADASA